MSSILCLILLTSLSVTASGAPASAKGTLDERLKAITLSVKDTLDIGDTYTSFKGALNEYGTVSLWDLSWSGDDGQLYVTVNENGRIVRYNYYGSRDIDRPSYGNMPRFPKINIDDAKSAAKAFLDKVLDARYETVELQGYSNLDYSGSAEYYLRGVLKLNGMESPVNVSFSVDSTTRMVTSFYRSDSGLDYGGVTKPSEASDKAAAAKALKSTLNMKLIYALPGDGTHTARLQYMPNPDGSYVIDAASGKLLDLSKLDWPDSRQPEYDSKEMGASPSAAPDSAGLTAVEQTAVDQLQGVLTQSDLERIIRSYAELGLTSDFVLRYLNYYTYQDENEQTQVTAAMELANVPEDETAQYRYITMDARTGRLLSLSSNRPYYMPVEKTGGESTAHKYSAQQAEATARSFAGRILPEELKQTALPAEDISPQDNTYNCRFSRTYDGIPFPENYIHVGVDTETGYVVGFYSNWYKFDVTFVPSAGAITQETAADKFSVGAGTALRYVSVPQSTHASGLLLAYTAENTAVWGVDAISGELLKSQENTDGGLQYNDMEGNPYAAVVMRLASYGIGFTGGSFKPDAQLTQEDALILILSATGRKYIPRPLSEDSGESSDELYNAAYSLGILTREEKNPAKPVTRAEFVKYLVNALGYKEVAVLPGIFSAGFKDDKTIPAGLMGYVAIARGIGIIRGDQNGMFRPNDISTRVMAAIMLHNCLSRK